MVETFSYIINMWLKVNNDKYCVKSVAKERSTYTNELKKLEDL